MLRESHSETQRRPKLICFEGRLTFDDDECREPASAGLAVSEAVAFCMETGVKRAAIVHAVHCLSFLMHRFFKKKNP